MNKARFLMSGLALCAMSLAQAQQAAVDALQEDIELFSSVLEESLGVGEETGLFGMSLGGVESTYIQGQGVVFEVRSPLANRRNQLSLASLNSAMQSLRNSGNPLEAIRRSSANATRTSALALSDTVAAADSFYQQMMDRIADVDFSLVVNSALQQASNSLRSLRAMGDVSNEEFAQLRDEVNSLRQQMQDHINSLRSLEERARNAITDTPDAGALRQEMSAQLDSLLAQIEPLRDQAVSRARELQARTEEAEQRYTQQWQADLAALEVRLFITLCDYGASLRTLPGTETVGLVLRNLGEDAADNSSRDKILVVNAADMQACQRGAIDSEQLRNRALAYSY